MYVVLVSYPHVYESRLYLKNKACDILYFFTKSNEMAKTNNELSP